MPRLARKFIHTALALFFVVLAHVVSAPVVIATALASIMVLVAARYMSALDSVRNAEQKSYGEYFFAIGVLICALLLLPHHLTAFTTALLVLGIADPAASLVGRSIGRHTYSVLGEKRSIEGSLAAFGISTALLLLAGLSLPYSIVGGVVLALVEAYSVRGADNLTLPLVAGVMVVLLG